MITAMWVSGLIWGVKRMGWRLCIVLLLALVLTQVAHAVHTSSFNYQMAVIVLNESGGALTADPVAVLMNPANLVAGSFLQADAEDHQAVDTSLTHMVTTAQDMTQDGVTWWMEVASLSDNGTGNFEIHMGDTSANRDQGFLFDGTTDTVTATDHADLDIVDDLTLLVDFTLNTWPASDTVLLEKSGAYNLGVNTTASNETIFARVYEELTVTLAPNATGDFENIDNEASCSAGSHWDCLQSNDGPTGSRVLEIDALPDDTLQDAVNVDDFTPTTAVITDIDIVCDTTNNPRGGQVGVRLSGTTGTLQDADFDCASVSNFARPGGGSWTPTDLDSVQLVVEITEFFDTATNVGFAYAAIVVTYADFTEVSTTTEQGGASLVAGINYRASFTYDNDLGSNQMRLFVNDSDDTAEANATATFDVATNANNVIVGSSIDGNLAEAGVANVATEEPTGAQFVLLWEFEPDDVAQTQAGDADNSWVWLGTVEDISTGGVDHDGSYSLTRDMTGITVTTGALVIKNPQDVALPVQTPQDIVGSAIVNPIATRVQAEWPLKEFFNARTLSANVSADAFWLFLVTVASIMAAILAYAATRVVLVAVLIWIAAYGVSFAMGLVPLWIPIMAVMGGFGAVVIERVVRD